MKTGSAAAKVALAILVVAGSGALGCGGEKSGGPGAPVDPEPARPGRGGSSSPSSGTGGSSGGGTGSGGAPAAGNMGNMGSPGGAGPAATDAAPGTGTGGAPAGSGGAGSPPASDAGVPDGAPSAGGVDDWSFLGKPVPILWFTINGAVAAPGLPKAQRTTGNLKVIYEHDGAALTSIAGKPVALDSAILIEHRGSSSYGFYAQKAYGFELQDAMKEPAGQPLHGMPKNADWVLTSCYADKTCLRNSLTYAIGREMAVPQGRWAPRSRWAEVYINGSYQGLYQLNEKPKDDKFRVNLPKPAPGAAPAEVGYMISADGDSRSFTWKTVNPAVEFLDSRARAAPPATNNRRWKFRAPSSEDMTPAQRQYVQQSFDRMTSALEGGGDWKSAVDVGSFVDYFIVAELTNNVDAFFKSWYFYKMPDSAGGKWSMGPIWDFDLAYGNANYYFRHCATNTQLGPISKQSPPTAADKDLPPPPYMAAALRDAALRNAMRCRWHELRKAGGPLDVTAIESRLDAFAAHIRQAKARDTAKWRNIGKYVWPNNYVGATWEDEIKYLKFWVRKRLAWIDGSLPGTCSATPAPPAVAAVPAPPSVRVDRSAQIYAGEGNLRHSDYVDIDGNTPPQWSCPR